MLSPPQRVRLQIVASDAIRPHEVADAGRQQRIELRLRADGMLRDPLIVGTVPNLDGYVLLDGTNRQKALSALELPWALVQVLDYADQQAVKLGTWCHAVRAPLTELLDGSTSIDGLHAAHLHPLEAAEALLEPSTLAVLADGSARVVLRRTAESPISRASQLRCLVGLYESRMSREDCEADSVEERALSIQSRADGLSTLVAFPAFPRSHVPSIAMEGELVPAGITRHSIPGGRALRVNLPLDVLSIRHSLAEANRALAQHLESLHPRHYQEPTVLFDS